MTSPRTRVQDEDLSVSSEETPALRTVSVTSLNANSDGDVLPSISRSLEERDGFSQFVADIVPFFRRRRLTYVDVGAYIGETFERILGSGLKVSEAHIIEPNVGSLNRAKQRATKLVDGDSVHYHQIALGARACRLRMRAAESKTKVVGLARSRSGRRAATKPDSTLFEVGCTTLDALSETFTERQISLLKVDVEGFESEVLLGARELLSEQRIDAIYIEGGLNPEQRSYYRSIEDTLQNHGYALFRIYEQHHEWSKDSPLLHRVNLAFLSRRFADSSPYRLSLELYEAQVQLRTWRKNALVGATQLQALKQEKEQLTSSLEIARAQLALATAARADLEKRTTANGNGLLHASHGVEAAHRASEDLRLAEVIRDRDRLAKELASLKEIHAETCRNAAAGRAALVSLSRSLSKARRTLRQVLAALAQLHRREAIARKEAAHARAETEHVRGGLCYRVGEIVVERISAPSRWIGAITRVWRMARSARDTSQGAPVAVTRVASDIRFPARKKHVSLPITMTEQKVLIQATPDPSELWATIFIADPSKSSTIEIVTEHRAGNTNGERAALNDGPRAWRRVELSGGKSALLSKIPGSDRDTTLELRRVSGAFGVLKLERREPAHARTPAPVQKQKQEQERAARIQTQTPKTKNETHSVPKAAHPVTKVVDRSNAVDGALPQKTGPQKIEGEAPTQAHNPARVKPQAPKKNGTHSAPKAAHPVTKVVDRSNAVDSPLPQKTGSQKIGGRAPTQARNSARMKPQAPKKNGTHSTPKSAHPVTKVVDRNNAVDSPLPQEIGPLEAIAAQGESSQVRALNIALVTRSFWPKCAGMELMVHNLASALKGIGNHVTLFAPRYPNEYQEIDHDYVLSRYGMTDEGLREPFERFHRERPFDVIYVQGAHTATTAVLKLKEEFGIPIVLRTHGEDIQTEPEMGYGLRLDPAADQEIRQNLNRSDVNVAIGKHILAETRVLAPRVPSVLIHNGVDVHRFSCERNHWLHEKLGLPKSTKILLTVGRNVRKKSFHLAVQALVIVKHAFEDVVLVHVGKDGDGNDLAREAESLGVSKSFYRLGEIDYFSMPQVYAAADIFVFTAKAETFGNVTVEAMASGLPCVEFDYSANRDKIVHGKTGYIVPYGDIDALANRLVDILNDGERRAAFSREGRRHVERMFSWPIIANKYHDIFCRVSARSSRTKKTTLRIAVVADKFIAIKGGGGERSLADLANAMVERGHEVFILIKEPGVSESQKPFYDVHPDVRIRNVCGWIEQEETRASERNPRSRVRMLAKEIADIGPDIVVGFFLPEFGYIARGVHGIDVPLVLSHRNDPRAKMTDLVRRHPKRLATTMYAYTRCQLMTVQMEQYKDMLPDSVRHKTVVIPNAVMPAEQDMRASPEVEASINTIVNVARLAPAKNQVLLIKAFAKIADRYASWQVKIYGDGPLEQELRSLIRDLGMERRVHLMGTVNDIRKVYRDAKVFAFPSLYEGFSRALSEAMTHGLPSVCVDACICSREFIGVSGGGLLSTNDVESYAEALETLICGPMLRKDMGVDASAFISRFERDKAFDLWDEVLFDVVSKFGTAEAAPFSAQQEITTAVIGNRKAPVRTRNVGGASLSVDL